MLGYAIGVVDVLNLYLDDSGTRHPDRNIETPPHGHDWFGLGGVMVDDEAGEEAVRARHDKLCEKWQLQTSLHSSEIRNKAKSFRWLRDLSPEKRDEFLADIAELVTSPELVAIACVIDRPGYNARYREKYGRARWLLCKTAFTVVVERATKYARSRRSKLRVLVEKSDQQTDRMLRAYYDDLRANGHPFDVASASRYTPLMAHEYRDTLYEFRTKAKTSPLLQISDLALWPICVGGYDTSNYAYRTLKTAGTLIDSRLRAEEVMERGIKYSCWQSPKKPEPDLATGLGQPPKGDLVG